MGTMTNREDAVLWYLLGSAIRLCQMCHTISINNSIYIDCLACHKSLTLPNATRFSIMSFR